MSKVSMTVIKGKNVSAAEIKKIPLKSEKGKSRNFYIGEYEWCLWWSIKSKTILVAKWKYLLKSATLTRVNWPTYLWIDSTIAGWILIYYILEKWYLQGWMFFIDFGWEKYWSTTCERRLGRTQSWGMGPEMRFKYIFSFWTVQLIQLFIFWQWYTES